MRKFTSMLLLGVLLTQAGCYGSFTLTKKLYKYNGSLGSPAVNTVVMWAMTIVPIYGLAIGIDAVILNTLEHFTGSNPIAMKEGEKNSNQWTHQGKTYTTETVKNQVRVTNEDGIEVLSMNYVEEEKTMYASVEGKEVKVLTILGDVNTSTTFLVYAADGTSYTFDSKYDSFETARMVFQGHLGN